MAHHTDADNNWYNYETCVYRGGQYASRYGPCDPATRRCLTLWIAHRFNRTGDPLLKLCLTMKATGNNKPNGNEKA